MNTTLIRQVIKAVKSCPAPGEVCVLTNINAKDLQAAPYSREDPITGYSWKWRGAGKNYLLVSIRLQAPEIQRQKKDGKVVLRVTPNQVSITSYSAGGVILDGSGEYEISFDATPQSEKPTPLDGLADLLRDALRVPLAV